MKFPDGASVYAWFAPTHWERFAGPIDGRVAVRPCPTLQDVATLYHDADLPRAIVRNAISGLASLSSASFNVSQQAVELAVGQFMGRYSRRCTLYQLMSYAANYGDYKRSLSSFDLNDVVSGFQRFTQKWHEAADRASVPNASRDHPEGGKGDGLISLARYIRRATTEHPLYVHGFCRDSHFVRRVPGDPDSRTEREQEERDRQEVEAMGETYYGGLRVGLCEVFTPGTCARPSDAPPSGRPPPIWARSSAVISTKSAETRRRAKKTKRGDRLPTDGEKRPQKRL